MHTEKYPYFISIKKRKETEEENFYQCQWLCTYFKIKNFFSRTYARVKCPIFYNCGGTKKFQPEKAFQIFFCLGSKDSLPPSFFPDQIFPLQEAFLFLKKAHSIPAIKQNIVLVTSTFFRWNTRIPFTANKRYIYNLTSNCKQKTYWFVS